MKPLEVLDENSPNTPYTIMMMVLKVRTFLRLLKGYNLHEDWWAEETGKIAARESEARTTRDYGYELLDHWLSQIIDRLDDLDITWETEGRP